MEKATFAAGCFWGVEHAFRKVRGVLASRVGYTGGTVANPTYKMVCTGTTRHAEAVEVTFDPSIVTYEELLHVFWGIHDPTSLNRQGPDIGVQYRSAIFFHSQEQRQAALNSKNLMQDKCRAEIVTEILPADVFYEAEDYHQQYHEKHGGSCLL